MAPNLFDQTSTCAPRVRYTATTSTASSNWDNNRTNYTSTSTGWSNYTIIIDKPSEEQIKKHIKKMMDRWCIESWTQHVFYRPVPKLQPISLRGVRLDGRGWAN